MLRSVRRVVLVAGVAAMALLGAACGSDDQASGGDSAPTPTQAAPSTSDSAASGSSEAMGGMVGAGCAGYAEQVPDGPGSVSGMAADPVAFAASNNPLLKTLVQAVSGKLNPQVNLVDTLNGGEFTVFAPVDDAFAKIDPATIDRKSVV